MTNFVTQFLKKIKCNTLGARQIALEKPKAKATGSQKKSLIEMEITKN